MSVCFEFVPHDFRRAVLLELDGALVVLIENVAGDCIPCLSMNFRVQMAYGR